MSDLIPIVPGCRAIILKGKAAGQEVTCLKFIGHPDAAQFKANTDYNDCWEIDTAVPWVSKRSGLTLDINVFPERYLMRIDGGANETNEERNTVPPERVT